MNFLQIRWNLQGGEVLPGERALWVPRVEVLAAPRRPQPRALGTRSKAVPYRR